MRLIIAVVLVVGACAKQAPPEDKPPAAPVMSAAEIQRSGDACRAYVERVCACAATVPAAKPKCDLARALPDAVRLALEVAASPDSKLDDVVSAQSSVRKTVKECIEQTARLPSSGCP